jgi:hypothetical protein
MWCSACYVSNPEISFHVRSLSDEEDAKDLERLTKRWGSKRKSPLDFHVARNGDHAMVPFECDLCIFRKLRKTSPDSAQPDDPLLMACIRRMNLDAFWSRATPTVNGNQDRLLFGIKMSWAAGLQGPYFHYGPMPSYDHCGYEVAIQMLLHSRHPGRYSRDRVQLDTIRKLRTCHGNQVRASPQANKQTLSLGDQKGCYQRFSADLAASFWFYRVFDGCRIRMGQDWRPNQAMSQDLLHKVQKVAGLWIEDAVTTRDHNCWIVFQAYVVVTYVVSLRGSEGLLLDLVGLICQWEKGDGSCVVIALLGKIKGEHHERCHLLPSVLVTQSGVKVAESLERLIATKRGNGFEDGPAISDEKGEAYSSRAIVDCLHKILEDLFDEKPTIFPQNIGDKEELKKRFQAFRTFRRTSDTQAVEMKVAQDDIDVVNRWKSTEKAKGVRPSRPMRQHYADMSLLLKPFIRYTWAM